jgi:hypothetical protein
VRRTAAIVFLLIWLINFSGASVFFMVQIHRQKRTMRELLASLPEKKLVHLTMSAVEFERLRVEKHELKINGRMFDIAFKKASGDRLDVYGLYDEKEDALLSSLRQESRQQHADPSAHQSITSFLSLQFLVPEEAYSVVQFTTTTRPSDTISLLYSSRLRAPEGPPPRVLS